MVENGCKLCVVVESITPVSNRANADAPLTRGFLIAHECRLDEDCRGPLGLELVALALRLWHASGACLLFTPAIPGHRQSPCAARFTANSATTTRASASMSTPSMSPCRIMR